ncbi:hypothetical protein CR513_21776, partial [Mucuna pruriens]
MCLVVDSLLYQNQKRFKRKSPNSLTKSWQGRVSPCAVAVILVPKKDHTWHMCMGYRPINAIISRYKYLIPCIDELHDRGFTQLLPHQLAGIKFRVDFRFSSRLPTKIVKPVLIVLVYHLSTLLYAIVTQQADYSAGIVNNRLELEATYIIKNKVQTQGVNSIRLPRRLPWSNDDGSPLLAKTLRIKSTRVRWQAKQSPLTTLGLSILDLRFLNREKHQ